MKYPRKGTCAALIVKLIEEGKTNAQVRFVARLEFPELKSTMPGIHYWRKRLRKDNPEILKSIGAGRKQEQEAKLKQ